MFPIFLNNESMKDATEDELPEICYIVAKNGIYLRKDLKLSVSMTKVDKISFLNEVRTHAKLKIKKIPFQTFLNIRELFGKSYEEFKAEAVGFLYYSYKRKDYHFHCPIQKVGGVSAYYEALPPGHKINKGKGDYLQTVSIHSHTMSAFHSGGDIMDEEGTDGLHITIGHIGDDEISLSVSVVINGNRFLVEPSEYIEGIDKYKIEAKIPDADLSKIPDAHPKYYAMFGLKKEKEVPKYKLPRDKHDVVKIDGWFKNIDGTSIALEWKKKHAERMAAFRSDVDSFVNPYRGAGNLFKNIVIREEGDKIDDCPCNTCIHKEKKIQMLADEYEEMLESVIWEDEDEEDINELETGNLFDSIYEDYIDDKLLSSKDIKRAGWEDNISNENNPTNYNFKPIKINDTLKGGLE